MKLAFGFILMAFIIVLTGCPSTTGDDDDNDAGPSADDDSAFDDDSADDDGDDDTGDDDTGDDDDDSVTIYDIQKGEIAPESTVTLTDVIVTTPESYDGSTIFVEEPDGGEYSGILIYMYDEVTAEYDFQPGDLVTLTGVYAEFYDMSEITVKDPADIQITGTADVPAPAVADPADIATGGSLSEAYEGVLCKVETVTVLEEADTYGEWIVTGELRIDDLFFESGQSPNPSQDDQFEFIIGALNYSYDDFKLEPRSLDDLEEIGGDDDTGDDDSGEDASIYDIQQGAYAQDEWVRVVGVIATTQISSASSKGKGLFVQESAGGPYSGIFVYVYDEVASGQDIEPGDVVEFYGQYKEYSGLSEIMVTNPDNFDETSSEAPPDPEIVTVAELGAKSGEEYEGVLCKVEDVTVTAAPDSYGEWKVTDDGGAHELIIDDYFFLPSPEPGAGDEYGAIIGPLYFSFGDFKLEPRGSGDLISK